MKIKEDVITKNIESGIVTGVALTASVFIRSIFAIGFVVTKKGLIDTFSVTTREFTIWADGFISLEFGQRLARSYNNKRIVFKISNFVRKKIDSYGRVCRSW